MRNADRIDFTRLSAEGVADLTPYEPGKPLEELAREYGIDDAVKLASNENPLGPSPAAVRAAGEALADAHRYPDGGGFALRRSLAERHGVDPACITLGNGSNDVLDLVARAFLGPARNAVFASHAFAVYPIVTRASGAEARVAPALGPETAQPYGHDPEALAERVDGATRVVFIANPNNPTGTWITTGALDALLERVPDDVIVVVDEAYWEYVDEPDYPDAMDRLARHRNLVVTRTFSKIHGMAGLRTGYAVSDPAIADLLNRVRQPFNVNAAAQAAAGAALEDTEHVRRALQVNREGRARLTDGLRERGFAPIPSVANFVTVDVGDDASAWYEALLRRGVIVRPMGAYGLPRHLRVSVGTARELDRFFGALDEIR